MAELIALALDISLGFLAYRLAFENRAQIRAVNADIALIKSVLKKAGLLDSDSN